MRMLYYAGCYVLAVAGVILVATVFVGTILWIAR